MIRKIQFFDSPKDLNRDWDRIASSYFQRKEFLTLLQDFNPCNQKYYELYLDDKLVAGAVVYTLFVNILTFSGLNLKVKMQVLGLPVSVAAPSLIGDQAEFNLFIQEILKREKGVILGLNLPTDLVLEKGIPMLTLPTIIFQNKYLNFENYLQSLRHQYRRRIKLIQQKASEIEYLVTNCNKFTQKHYELYLEIMKRTKTKLEVLKCDLFQNLPPNFVLTTLCNNGSILAWNIVCNDHDIVYFFFGGMDYCKRDHFQSYNNNLLSILKTGIENHCSLIDFGQTAEIAKIRLGGEIVGRGMFLYHQNPFILFLFNRLKRWFTYSNEPALAHVFKK